MRDERLWSPIFVAIVAATLCCFLVGQGANAGTSVYLDRIGGTTGLAGIGALTFSLAAASARIVCGPLIDIRGRAIIMVIGALVMLCGTLGPLIANDGTAFICWRILQGIGFAAATTASATAAADVLPLSKLGEGIGYYGLGQAISMSIGPALAILLISTDPPENFYLGLSGCAAAALIFSLLCRYEKDPSRLPETAEYRIRWEEGRVGRIEGGDAEPQPPHEVSPDSSLPLSVDAARASRPGVLCRALESILEPSALPGTVPMMLIATAFGFGIFYMGVFGASLEVGNAGIFYTVSAVFMILVRLTSSRFMDKVRPLKIMGAAVLCGIAAYAIMLLCAILDRGAQTELLFYIAGVPYGLSLGIALPINQTVAVRKSPPDRWGAANGLYLLGNDISIGISSLAWGFTIQAIGFGATFLIIIAFIAASFFAAVLCYPRD